MADLVAEQYPGTRFVERPMPPGDPIGGYASTHRLTAVLGWRPRITIGEGVSRYANWLARTPEAIPAWLRDESEATPTRPVR
ncbi:hypothetical protein RM844_16700 [Streptomyces sp. DSM 44915]|uniref:Uncharacterized protein n=1 Tax=Streptomyces chisholmiae TaxID=3075540 RepID=A0ABU2JT36_9ACTN|nr:hypothetical protein [Streptomyces sp. DSM 44915]MDT0267921.1 hypothetical protein [Streptomyces sp. DSM 44915]